MTFLQISDRICQKFNNQKWKITRCFSFSSGFAANVFLCLGPFHFCLQCLSNFLQLEIFLPETDVHLLLVKPQTKIIENIHVVDKRFKRGWGGISPVMEDLFRGPRRHINKMIASLQCVPVPHYFRIMGASDQRQ